MLEKANSPEEYINHLSFERQGVMNELREVILKNIPKGFEETMGYGMIAYVIPHTIYPSGYHANPKLPLPFLNIASQKNNIAIYHMGIYADKTLREWFITEYAKFSNLKLDIGKSCIRFKKPEQISFELIGRLVKKMSAKEWIRIYNEGIKK